MPRKVFTAGEVLAAADVNNFLMDQAVMTFAGTAARGSAIPTPTEGMVTYLDDSNLVEVFDGSAFVSIAPPAANVGLEYITKETGTAVSAINVNNCFSASYTNYRIIFNGTTSAAPITMRLRAGGSDDSAANYRESRFDQEATVLAGQRNTGLTNWGNIFVPIGVTNHNVLEVSNPFEASVTAAYVTRSEAPNGNINARTLHFGINTTTSYDGFTLSVGSGTMTGTVLIYGYNLG